MAILDWSVGPTYIMKLLGCQHEQKPSVQQLVKAVTGDFLVRLAEPSVRSAYVMRGYLTDITHLRLNRPSS